MTTRALVALAWIATGCGDPTTGPDDTAPDDTAPDAGNLATAIGDVTWSVDFDDGAEADGYEDCSYTRTYTGVEDLSAPWVCPMCEGLFRAGVSLDETECYEIISSSAVAPGEWIGWYDDVWVRNGRDFGAAVIGADRVDVTAAFDAQPIGGGNYALSVAGSLDLGLTDGDPLGGWVAAESYTCGWPKADPPPYDGDYALAVGSMLPDGVFDDVCEEHVRLQDFAGAYLVVDISATDCGPCQSAAAVEDAFVEQMATEGIEVRFVTLLAPTLSDTSGTPTPAQLQAWASGYDLTSAVLADRAWGVSVPGRAVEDYAYPTFIVADPDLVVIGTDVGFGGDFEALADMMRADAGG